MTLKILSPTTPGRRLAHVDQFEDITSQEPKKSLVVMLKRSGGRNNQGRITVRHRGGGQKRYYRIIDFKQDKYDMPAKVVSIEYDPNRSVRIARVVYPDKEERYVLAPQNLKVGDEILSSLNQIPPRLGYRMPLKYIPIGTEIYNLEMKPQTGGKIVRSAGLSAKLLAVEGDFAQVKLPSGEVRLFKADCLANIGSLSNPDYALLRIGKAGRKRHMGWRPEVRGKAMNPVDHPHGGGEGHCPIGLKHPKTPWGKPALGVKTRKPGKWSDKFILKRRK